MLGEIPEDLLVFFITTDITLLLFTVYLTNVYIALSLLFIHFEVD